MRSPATGELGGRGPQARALPSNGGGGPAPPPPRAEPAGASPSLIASLLAFVAGERFAFIRNSDLPEPGEVDLDRVERLGAHALAALGFEHQRPALELTPEHLEGARVGIDVPDVRDAGAM